jgi:hypothetical protein
MPPAEPAPDVIRGTPALLLGSRPGEPRVSRGISDKKFGNEYNQL